ncbi:MAG TPA: pyruvate dehydrogenase complex dihydrolipoamide acetyltransferase [Chitinophagaceae bacterium]|nr:pyruvate dehydrogenase complex dihydrolipoamide acetyltransferase [Chitinophagaceae bacterium]
MAEVILMPRLSDTMTEGVIASWHKKVGDKVKKGDLLAEVETDKATMDLESYKDGTLLYIGVDKGGKLQVNDLLAIIGAPGEDVSELVKQNTGSKSSASATQQPASSTGADAESDQSQKTEKKATTETKKEVTQPSDNGDGRIKASPLAKKMAAEKGIDINRLQGTGDGGRIVKADVDIQKHSAASGSSSSSQEFQKKVAALQPFTAGEEGYTDISNSQIRNIIAKRLTESKFTSPHFYLTMEINMDNAISARTQLNEVSPVKISFNDLVVKAAALALRMHPAVNASWMPARAGTDGGDKIRRFHHIHIGIAVAIEDGLIVPVVRFADQKSLPQIAAESKELSGRARNKKLSPNEFSGNTFTISNLGMMDIDEFTAIINPPDSCIMAVGKIKEVVVRKTDGFGVSNVMKITMSCDHRSVDGATGAAFMQTFKKYLENPVMMLL